MWWICPSETYPPVSLEAKERQSTLRFEEHRAYSADRALLQHCEVELPVLSADRKGEVVSVERPCSLSIRDIFISFLYEGL